MRSLNIAQQQAFRQLCERDENLPSRLQQLQQRLGYTFGDQTLLLEALTHSSLARSLNNDCDPNQLQYSWNERLEFLGDAVLGLVIGDRLMQEQPQVAEGDLSRMRAALISEAALATTAKKLRMGDELLLARGEQMSGGAGKDSMLADALEALIGAIYADGGLESAQDFVRLFWGEDLAAASQDLTEPDYKTTLQELAQEHLGRTPTYETIGSEGPDHRLNFTVVCHLNDEVMGKGDGPSKKAASQAAAKVALQRFQSLAKEAQL